MAGDKLRINKESQKIKKPVGVPLGNDIHQVPVTIHFRPSRVIQVEMKNFKKLVEKLTGQGDNDKCKKMKSMETLRTNKALVDQTKNVSEASSDLAIVKVELPNKPAPNEVCSALPSTLADYLRGPSKCEPPPNEFCSALPSTLADSFRAPNNICWKEVDMPGDQLVPPLSCPTPTYDGFQGMSCADNVLHDLMKIANDVWEKLEAPLRTHDIFPEMDHTESP